MIVAKMATRNIFGILEIFGKQKRRQIKSKGKLDKKIKTSKIKEVCVKAPDLVDVDSPATAPEILLLLP